MDEKEIKEICLYCKQYIPDDTLEMYIEYTQQHYPGCWLQLLEERLRRQELEIYIL